jgi:eukaryotic-like serine/threonine-protein kinase
VVVRGITPRRVGMTPPLETVEEVFHAALECEPYQLSAFLDERCAGDEILRTKVEDLLAAHREAGSFIETPVIDLADSGIADDQERDSLIGQTIGHYKILRRISAGGMGAVYLAERADQQYQKQVAIKLIKRGMDTDSVLRHFRNERQILASFDHPNIARLLDGGATESGLPYFVMEYVEGLPVNAYCDAHALSIVERLKLFREMCAAVSYAHRRTVIHRDVKPSNILVTSDGTPKLLDFGIAKILQPADAVESLATLTGVRLMTPHYASPEQVRGQALTTATDVYSLGVVLYQLLTGRKPYRLKTQTPEDISRAILEQEPPRPSSVVVSASSRSPAGWKPAPRLRGDLDNIVLMALRKEPERRYQSVEQFSEDIRRYLEALPVRARKDTLSYRSAKFVRRNTMATAAAALIFLTLIGGIIATTWQAHRAKAEKARAERRFNDVRQLAHSVLFDYHDAIKDLPGATRVREQLVKDALTYLDSLAGEATGDPDLQRELASAYERVGDVRGQVFSASLGDMTGAMESYQKALRIRETMVAADPHNVHDQRYLAAIYQKIGKQSLETTETAQSLEYLRRALALYVQLTAEHPADADVRYDLAGIYNDIGMALEDRGDISGMLENHRQSLPIREQFVAEDPLNPKYRRDLAVTYINLGRALYLSRDFKAAVESNNKAVALAAALTAEVPDNADYRRILANTYQNDGDYRNRLGDTANALESFRKKIALDEQSLNADPANAASWGDFGYSCKRIGELLADSGDYSQALSYHKKARQMWEKGLASAPQHMGARYQLIISLASIAQAQAKLGERTASLEECAKAQGLLEKTDDDDPTNAALRTIRAEAYMILGGAYAALAESEKLPAGEVREYWRTARDNYQRSLDIYLDTRKRRIATSEDAGDKVTAEIARCDTALAR